VFCFDGAPGDTAPAGRNCSGMVTGALGAHRQSRAKKQRYARNHKDRMKLPLQLTWQAKHPLKGLREKKTACQSIPWVVQTSNTKKNRIDIYENLKACPWAGSSSAAYHVCWLKMRAHSGPPEVPTSNIEC